MRVLVALALVALAAGCAAKPPVPAEIADAAQTEVEAVVSGIELQGCRQFHTYYRSPAAMFRAFVPAGFRLQTVDAAGQFVDVGVAASRCVGSGPPTAEFLVTIPVLPPEAYRQNGTITSNLVPLVLYVDGDTLLAQYQGWNLTIAQAGKVSIAILQDTAAALVEETTARGEGETYTVRTTLQRQGGDFRANTFRLWAVHDGKAVNGIIVNHTQAPNVGLGLAGFQYQGSGAAPPLHAGIGHSVDKVATRLVYEPLRLP